ncbi:MAG: hypothetical protein PHT74_08975, partial [Methanoculleus horonobensis]|nr:hypothetical protein [Methanoculleus horonobensis]
VNVPSGVSMVRIFSAALSLITCHLTTGRLQYFGSMKPRRSGFPAGVRGWAFDPSLPLIRNLIHMVW